MLASKANVQRRKYAVKVIGNMLFIPITNANGIRVWINDLLSMF